MKIATSLTMGACLLLMMMTGCGNDTSTDGNTPPDCEGESPGTYTPPAGARFASLPYGAAINLTTGAVDPQGVSGDLRYEDGSQVGLTAAPCGVSWWTGENLDDFTAWLASTAYLPPAQGWTPSTTVAGSAGVGTSWLKIAGGRYAMIHPVAVRDCFLEFFYVAPYGAYTWSDAAAPTPPTIQSVTPGAVPGTLDVSWLASPSPDAAGYWVACGTDTRSRPEWCAEAALSFTITGLESGRAHYVWVVAYDQEGNRSDYSAAVTATPH